MATLDQRRAALAFTHVSDLASPDKKATAKQYASLAHKLPALLTSAGLCQALHFLQTRSDAGATLVKHLSEQLQRTEQRCTSDAALLKLVREASLGPYLRLTEETLACAAWYRRMVQSVLKLEAADADDGTD
ncbi:MAG: type III-B CRISPR module-associated protein Cmr5 [Kofleriaceae bacterium]